jgi:DNA-binding XRE family transcriptional regulator
MPFKASTPARVLQDVRMKYAIYLEDDPDDYVDYFETDFAKRMEARMTPAKSLGILREAHGWSQARLAAEVGGVSAKRISDWENGRRAISKEFAKKLGKLFNFPADKFI